MQMMLPRKARIVLFTIAGIMALILAGYPSAEVQAADPVKLELGGSGAMPWSIANIKPGDSGNSTTTLRNAGYRDGTVTIWISDIVNAEGTNPESETGNIAEPGELGEYLLFNVSCSRLVTSITLPTKIQNMPQSVSISSYLKINRLNAGETIVLEWQWELPPQVGNDVQGDNISFTINYLLEELPSSEPEPEPGEEVAPPPIRILPTVMEGKRGGIRVGTEGIIVQEATTLASATGNFVIGIGRGVTITGTNGIVLELLELTVVEKTIKELTSIPENTVALSPVYKITGYSNGNEVSQVNFNPYIDITISYDPKNLPENALPPYIVNFSSGSSLARLETPFDAVFEIGKAKGIVYHASYFAVVTEVAPPPPPLPAKFVISNLIINPKMARPGQPVSVSVDVANDGAVTGSCDLYLVIDDIVRSVKEITVGPNSITTVKFEVSNLAVGKHSVRIGGLIGAFQVVSTVVSPARTQVDWRLIDLSISAIMLAILLASYLSIRKSQRQHLA